MRSVLVFSAIFTLLVGLLVVIFLPTINLTEQIEQTNQILEEYGYVANGIVVLDKNRILEILDDRELIHVVEEQSGDEVSLIDILNKINGSFPILKEFR